MHPLERSYSAFMQRFGKQLDDAEASYRAEASAYGEDVSAVCLSKRGALHFLGVGVHDAHFVAAVRFAEQLQAWAAYRRHRHLYVLNDQLAELLCEASWPEELDVSSLFLPVPGAAISVRLASGAAQSHFVGFYDELPDRVVEKQLRFARLEPDGSLAPCGGVRLSGGNLEQTIRAEVDEIRRVADRRRLQLQRDAVADHLDRDMHRLEQEMQIRGRLLRQLFNVLLYIHGNQDVVARVHPGVKPAARASRPRAVRRAREKNSAIVFDVGRDFAATLQHWEDEKKRPTAVDCADPQHRVRPHVRRAHLHLYWTGRGRETPKFQLVRPTLVHGGNGGDRPSTRNVR